MSLELLDSMFGEVYDALHLRVLWHLDEVGKQHEAVIIRSGELIGAFRRCCLQHDGVG